MDVLLAKLGEYGATGVVLGVVLYAYFRLVNDVIAVVRINTKAATENAEAVKQSTQVMVEVKDAINRCQNRNLV